MVLYKKVSEMSAAQRDAIVSDLIDALNAGTLRDGGRAPIWDSLDAVMVAPTEMRVVLGQPKRGQLFIDANGQVVRAKRDHTRDGVQKPVVLMDDETS